MEPPGKRRRAAAGAVSGAAKEQQRAVAQGRRKMLKVDIATHAQVRLYMPLLSPRPRRGDEAGPDLTRSPTGCVARPRSLHSRRQGHQVARSQAPERVSAACPTPHPFTPDTLASQLVEDEDPMVCKLAMLSLATVFVDVLPDYRIRPPTELELGMSVSKEQKRLRNFEMGMLSAYQVRAALSHAQRECAGLHPALRLSRTPTALPAAAGAPREGVRQRGPGQRLPRADVGQVHVPAAAQGRLLQLQVQPHPGHRAADGGEGGLCAPPGVRRHLHPLCRGAPARCSALATAGHRDRPLTLTSRPYTQDRPSEASMEAAQKIHDLVKARHGRVDPEALETCASDALCLPPS